MSLEWFDSIDDTDDALNGYQTDSFYCPYSNTSQCTLVTKGLQPQELCLALDCEQVKLVQRNPRSAIDFMPQ